MVQKTKQLEIQQQSATEQHKLNKSLSFDGASSQNEVKNFILLLIEALITS